MRRQLLLNFRMQANAMAHVDQIGLLRFYSLDIRKSFLQRFMHRVSSPAESCQDQHIQTFQFGILFFRKIFYICQVSHITNTITEDRQFPVHHPDWRYRDAGNHKRFVSDPVKFQVRNSRIFMGTEHIRDARLDSFRHIIFRIHIHPLFTAKRAQVVQSADMIVMFVRDQDCIQVIRLVADHLPTEIRAAIQQDPLTIRLHQYGRTQTPIPFIRTGTHLTLTTYFGNSGRSPRP